MAANFWEKDSGYNQFMANMKKTLGQNSVFVGWLRSSGTYKARSGRKGGKASITVAQIASIMEFGSKDGRIPERSVLRSVMRIYRGQIESLLRKLSLQIMLGAMDEKHALGILGQFVSDLVRKRIQDGVPPPNKPATIRRKGSSKTLIDTGQLVGAVDWEVRKAGKK